MATSFLSEHSAEFVLVPKFCKILSNHFRRVTPLYFWSTREGGRISRSCDNGSRIFLVALFARRPKVRFPRDNTIIMKVNYELFNKAKLLEKSGVPVFAGVPLVSDIFDLTLESECAWVSINGNHVSDVEHEITISPKCTWGLNGDEILNIIDSKSSTMNWNDAINIISELTSEVGNGMFGMQGYKPVFFLLIK